jgi:hypothetical protein
MVRATFQSPIALAVMDKIAAHLVKHGEATVADLSVATGLHIGTVGQYLRHMQDLQTAHCAVPSTTYQGGTTKARWSAGKAPAISTNPTGVRRCVVVRKQWEPNHARSMMDCLLFGTPEILRATA